MKLCYERSPNYSGEGPEVVSLLQKGTLPSCIDIVDVFFSARPNEGHGDLLCPKGCHRIVVSGAITAPTDMMLEVHELSKEEIQEQVQKQRKARRDKACG